MLKLVVDNTEKPIKVNTDALNKARGRTKTVETHEEKQNRLEKKRKADNDKLLKKLRMIK